MASALTLHEVLQFLEANTQSIHACKVHVDAAKIPSENTFSLRWRVTNYLLFPGDTEVFLEVEGVDDDRLHWSLGDAEGDWLPELKVAVERTWERCEALQGVA